jgi:hypothetical protein
MLGEQDPLLEGVFFRVQILPLKVLDHVARAVDGRSARSISGCFQPATSFAIWLPMPIRKTDLQGRMRRLDELARLLPIEGG